LPNGVRHQFFAHRVQNEVNAKSVIFPWRSLKCLDFRVRYKDQCRRHVLSHPHANQITKHASSHRNRDAPFRKWFAVEKPLNASDYSL